MMETNPNDPLASLFASDAKDINRNQLATLVKPFLTIDSESRDFVFLPAFSGIKGNEAKLEILLAAVKARSLFLNEPDGLLPGEIIKLDIMPVGSVKASLKRLSDDHVIKKNKEGHYLLPAYRIPELLKQFGNQSL